MRITIKNLAEKHITALGICPVGGMKDMLDSTIKIFWDLESIGLVKRKEFHIGDWGWDITEKGKEVLAERS